MANSPDTAFYIPHNEASLFFNPYFLVTLAQFLEQAGHERVRFSHKKFSDGSPLLLAPENLQHVLMSMWLSGNNHDAVMAELAKTKAFNMIREGFVEPNVRLLGAFFAYLEARQDRETLKPVPLEVDPNGGYAIVVSQVNQVRIVAEQMAHLDYLITIDFHSKRAADTLEEHGKLKLIHLSAYKQFADYLLAKGYVNKGDPNTIVMSSDIGSLPRNYALSEYLGLDSDNMAIVTKKSVQKNQGTDREVTQEIINGSVEGKIVIIFDDMISSGGTSKGVCELALAHGAKEVIFIATHPIFVKGYYNTLKSMMLNPKIRVIVGNTLPLTENGLVDAVRIDEQTDLPYIRKSGPDGEEIVEYLEMLDLSDFMKSVMLRTLAQTSLEGIVEALQEDTLDFVDPIELFEIITGDKPGINPITHVYMKGGEYIPLKTFMKEYHR